MISNNANSNITNEEIFKTIRNNPDNYDLSLLSKTKSEYEKLIIMMHEASLQLDLKLSVTQYWQLLKYLDTLLLWNKTYNLTAITDPTEAVIKHIIDCMSIVPTLTNKKYNFSKNDMLDIGAGAGLPSVVVAICHPERICTPLDSNQKRIRFIRQVTGELGLTNIKPVASRIENFEGKFKLITSRAFASLTDFVELAEPYLDTTNDTDGDNLGNNTGQLLAMKGKPPLKQEINILKNHWEIEILPINLPYLADSRHLVRLSKIKI